MIQIAVYFLCFSFPCQWFDSVVWSFDRRLWFIVRRELDDELQDTLYEFLEARGINDEMAIFLHEYIRNKGKTEFIRWMGTVKSYIESK